MITGFTKTKTGTFDQTDINAIFAEIKARLAAASVQEDVGTVFRFGAAGAVPGRDTDDTPFYRFENDQLGSGLIVQAYVGETGGAMGTRATGGFEPALRPGVRDTVHFACSAGEGWWWLAAQDSATPGSGRITAGCGFRRAAPDMTVGLCPRFGLLTGESDGLAFHLPYATDIDGIVATGARLWAASPMGAGAAIRPSGSPLPKGIAPIYPTATNGLSGMAVAPVIFGDADCAMMATDGFAWGEEAAPGWRVFGRTDTTPKYCRYVALRSPAAFDVLA
jgi:hypothetical protein